MSRYYESDRNTKVWASAVIEVTLEVPANSSWGGDCELKQIHSQAREETLNGLLTTLRVKYPGVKVVGRPVVKAILTREQR